MTLKKVAKKKTSTNFFFDKLFKATTLQYNDELWMKVTENALHLSGKKRQGFQLAICSLDTYSTWVDPERKWNSGSKSRFHKQRTVSHARCQRLGTKTTKSRTLYSDNYLHQIQSNVKEMFFYHLKDDREDEQDSDKLLRAFSYSTLTQRFHLFMMNVKQNVTCIFEMGNY